MKQTPTRSKSVLPPQQRRNLDRIARSVNQANALLKIFTDHPPETYQLLLQVAGQIVFENAVIQFIRLLLDAGRKERAHGKSSVCGKKPRRLL